MDVKECGALEGCIFCMIARGEIPAKIVYENDVVLAFDDIHPQAPVHTLIIPKEHYSGLDDTVPDAVLAALLKSVPEVAAVKGVADTGYRTILNTGPDAGQTVAHLHAHVLGGRGLGEGMV
jgi:histidine triad (HIT) family protein